MAQQNRPSPPPLPPLSPSSSARRTGTRPARAATRPGHLLPPSLPGFPSSRLDDASATPWTPSPSPSPSFLSSASSLSLAERSRRRRRAPSRPPPPPRLTDAPGSSASTPSSSPPIHGPPEALQRRLQAHLQPSAAVNLIVDSPPFVLPRARRPALHDPREPCRLSPLFSLRNVPSSRPNHRSRSLLAAGHGAAVARATPACARACYQVCRPPRSPQHPSVSPLVHRSAVFDLGRTPVAT